MAKKVTITLDDELLAFVDQQAAALGTKASRSGYIKALIAAHRFCVMEAEMCLDVKENNQDLNEQLDLTVWDFLIEDDSDLFD